MSLLPERVLMGLSKSPDIIHKGIRLQIQPNKATCTQTCLAMALGVPVEMVLDVYGDKAMSSQALLGALRECKTLYDRSDSFVADGWYFAQAPSLNIRGGMHTMLIHFELGEGLRVFDPNRRRKHCYYYAGDGGDLKTWGRLIYFRPGGELPKKRQ